MNNHYSIVLQQQIIPMKTYIQLHKLRINATDARLMQKENLINLGFDS